MPLKGKDVWDAIVKLGSRSGTPRPSDKIAGLLNEVERQSWLPNLIETEDAMRVWEANTSDEKVQRLCKFLKYDRLYVVGIDAAIEARGKKEHAIGYRFADQEDSPMNRVANFAQPLGRTAPSPRAVSAFDKIINSTSIPPHAVGQDNALVSPNYRQAPPHLFQRETGADAKNLRRFRAHVRLPS